MESPWASWNTKVPHNSRRQEKSAKVGLALWALLLESLIHMETKNPTHVCEYCEGEFSCIGRVVDKDGIVWCQCIQDIVTDQKNNYEVSRIAFWCSAVCSDEEYREEETDEESDEDERLCDHCAAGICKHSGGDCEYYPSWCECTRGKTA